MSVVSEWGHHRSGDRVAPPWPRWWPGLDRPAPDRTTLVVTVTHPAGVEHGEVTSQLSREDWIVVDGAESPVLREEPFARLRKYARVLSLITNRQHAMAGHCHRPAERSQVVLLNTWPTLPLSVERFLGPLGTGGRVCTRMGS